MVRGSEQNIFRTIDKRKLYKLLLYRWWLNNLPASMLNKFSSLGRPSEKWQRGSRTACMDNIHSYGGHGSSGGGGGVLAKRRRGGCAFMRVLSLRVQV
jgi:hypothetical protein